VPKSHPTSSAPILLAVGLLCILKLGLTLALLAGNPLVFLYGDGTEYVSLAETWYRTGQYARVVDVPENFRLPGYSAFLLLFQPISEAYRYATVSIVQMLILHVWLLLVGLWMQRRFGLASALVFVILLSLTITWIHYPATIHADFQFAVLVFSGLVLWLEALDDNDLRVGLLGGSAFCWMMAALTRPDLAVFPVWLLTSLAVTVAWNRLWRPRPPIDIHGQIVVLAVVLGTILLWAFRNLLVSGRFTYTVVLNYAVNLFAADRSGPDTAAGAVRHTDLALLDIVFGLARHVRTLTGEAIPALIKIFINPGRWYLHRYSEALGIEIETAAVPFEAARGLGLPPSELAYIAFNIGVSILIGAMLLLFLWRTVKGTTVAPPGWVGITVWVLLFFLLQKAAWGAFDPGSGPRYGMSMYPFIVFLGALAVARPLGRAADPSGAPFGSP